MRITTTLDADAGSLVIEVEGRVGLLPLDQVRVMLASAAGAALAEPDDPAIDAYHDLLAQGLGAGS